MNYLQPDVLLINEVADGTVATNTILVRILLLPCAMKTLCRSLVRDGDELLVAVPENRTVEFYNYLRGFGFCFTLHSRGFCEDNVFCFHESENTERLSAIVSAFPLHVNS